MLCKTNKQNSESGMQNAESDDVNVVTAAKGETDEGNGADESETAMDSAAQKTDEDNSGFRIPNSGLEQAIAALQEELSAEKDKYLRLAAEYDNFRKRSNKLRDTTYSDARADTIIRLLPVYDNLERAMKMECVDEAFYKGIEMTMSGLTEILENMDIKQIQAVGEQFDPNRHNAVTTIENPDLGEKIVAEEFQKGFMLGDRVIRFSTVVVAN